MIDGRTIVISPSGNFYGSEQVLYDFLKTNYFQYEVFVPKNSRFSGILNELSNRHTIKVFDSICVLYIKILFSLFRHNVKCVYVNEGGHIRWILLLSKLFRNKNFIVHLRIVEDIKRIPNRLSKNLKIVTISHFMMSQIDKKYPSLLVYDPFTFSNDERVFCNKSLPFKIAIIGRISVNKGIIEIRELVKAIAKSNHPFAKCIVIKFYGSVAKDKVVQDIITDLKLNYEEYCHFVGFVDTIEIYKNVDMILHLARREPLGRVFFEALDNGVPLVGFNCGGIGELGKITKLENNLVEYDDTNWVDKMLHKIYNLIENYNENMQIVMKAKLNCKHFFSQKVYNISLNKIIESKIQ